MLTPETIKELYWTRQFTLREALRELEPFMAENVARRYLGVGIYATR